MSETSKRAELLAKKGLIKAPEPTPIKGLISPKNLAILRALEGETKMTEAEIVTLAVSEYLAKLNRELDRASKSAATKNLTSSLA